MYNLIGVGIGPFNLSLAALMKKDEQKNALFLDNKEEFSWHRELMFSNASMQTNFLKDLVTPVDPTNPHSFLSYLVDKGLFYHFVNTDRKNIQRYEFEDYCKWVSQRLGDMLHFKINVEKIEFKNGLFEVQTNKKTLLTSNICIASGPTPNIPKFVIPFLGPKVFHAKSKYIKGLDLSDKRVLIVGGGQTGVEIFRNSINEKWGKCRHIKLITGRENLRPLDEAPFTNNMFTPEFVQNFHELESSKKEEITNSLLLTSDGNTPSYLQELYNELYLDRFYHHKFSEYSISPMRWLNAINRNGDGYCVEIKNLLTNENDFFDFDIVILATGFRSDIPSYMEGIRDYLVLDDKGRLEIDKHYQVKTILEKNKIYAMNFSRHGHGVADPQTSLMSWRSAMIINDLYEKNIYKTQNTETNFLNFFKG